MATPNTPEFMQKLQSSEITVDEEGQWFNDGVAITREDILQFFIENLRELPDGKYAIAWGGSLCSVSAADTPFVISRVDRTEKGDATTATFLVRLKHHPQARALDPATLVSGAGNVLYCRLRDSGFRARFSRPAYYQLAEWIEEDPETGEFHLAAGSVRFPIRMEPQTN